MRAGNRSYPSHTHLFIPVIETLEKSVKYVLVSLLLTLNGFTPLSSVFIVDFEQVNVCCVGVL